MAELYIGLMSGTSMDGIDAVVLDLSGNPHILATTFTPYDKPVRDRLARLCTEGSTGLLASMDTELGILFAQAALDVLHKSGMSPQQIRAIGSHGQTIHHEPRAPFPNSLQIANPNVIAEYTGITTVADFRRRDIAAGGQGAPLVPAFHNEVFQVPDHDRVIVNIGGIANITLLPGNKDLAVTGFDTGPGNVLLDGWAERHLGTAYDADGQWGASGEIDQRLLEILLAHPYFDLQSPKSTGREEFNLQWLDEVLEGMHLALSPQDIQATLCELTARSIASSIHKHPAQVHEVLICGGGTHNRLLMQRLRVHLQDASIHSTEQFGIPPDWVESAAFAWLASQTLSGRPGNLPSVTGATEPVVLGGIYTA